MSEGEFARQVGGHFRYLIDEYGFAVVEARNDPEAFGNSLVRFRSDAVDLIIVLDRGQVLIDFDPCGMTSGDQFGLPSVVRFLASEADEPAVAFPEIWVNYDDMIEWQMEKLAHLLRKTCAPVLQGEFSDWKAIKDLCRREAGKACRAITGNEPIRLVSD